MTLQEAIEFLEDMQPDACENCSLKETCDNAGTGVCVEALNILKAEAQRATNLQAKIDSSELERLRAENAKLRELVGLAVEDMKPIEYCDNCSGGTQRCVECDGQSNWQWQHADKLKEIDGKDGR